CPGLDDGDGVQWESHHPPAEVRLQRITHPAEDNHALILAACRCRRRIWETPVDPLRRAWERRARLCGSVAYCDHVIERLPGKLADGLRAIVSNLNAAFLHCSNRQRMHSGGLNARTNDVEATVRQCP